MAWGISDQLTVAHTERIDKQTEEHFTNRKYFSVGHCLRPYLLILRSIGPYPFSVTKTADGLLQYSTKWNSFSTFYSGLHIGAFFLGFVYWWRNYINYLQSPSERILAIGLHNFTTHVEAFCLRAFPTINPCLSISFIISSISTTAVLIEVIHNWDSFENKYQNVFAPTNTTSETMLFKGLWDFKKKGSILGCITFIMLLVSTRNISNLQACGLPPDVLEKSPFIFSFMCKVFGNFTLFVALHSFMEDFKNMILLKSIEIGFEKVLDGIKRQTDEFRYKKSLLMKFGDVHNWSDLILRIRKQATVLGDIMAWGQLFNIFIIFVTFILSLFMSIRLMINTNLARDDISRQMIISSLYLCLLAYFRLITKAWMAKNIEMREKAISNQLRLMGPTHDDLLIGIEISMIIELLDSKPTRINLDNIIVNLNYSYLFMLVGQVVTYLVVLFQFNNLQLT